MHQSLEYPSYVVNLLMKNTHNEYDNIIRMSINLYDYCIIYAVLLSVTWMIEKYVNIVIFHIFRAKNPTL